MDLRIMMLTFLVLAGCGSKTPTGDAPEVITRQGVIVNREEVSIDEAREKSKTRTSVYGSVSSGGGVSIGIGVLLSSILSDKSARQPLRYEVELADGERMTIYHDSPDFAVKDCVEIKVHPDEKKHPPSMQRIACQ